MLSLKGKKPAPPQADVRFAAEAFGPIDSKSIIARHMFIEVWLWLKLYILVYGTKQGATAQSHLPTKSIGILGWLREEAHSWVHKYSLQHNILAETV